MQNTTLFQFCQKLVIFTPDFSKALLAKRKGEEDFDGVYSLIGGKMETTDKDILAGIKREKDEEVGEDFKIKVYPELSVNVHFIKNSGQAMILPHYLATRVSGEVELNEEYSEYQWVKVESLIEFQPLIQSVPKIVEQLLSLRENLDKFTSTIV